MPNWTTITDTAINASRNAAYLTELRDMASTNGYADPFPELVSDVVSQIRARISTGNTLDVDPTKIPNSLKGLALRMLGRAIKSALPVALSEDERTEAKDDLSYLNRITDEKIRFELPDSPAGTAEKQSGEGISVVSGSRPFATRRTMDGLL